MLQIRENLAVTLKNEQIADPQELAEAWESYLSKKDIESRNVLVTHYLWLVRYVLNGMRLPSYSVLSDDDFKGFGIIGLHEALERFESSRGLKFETFAYHRIKGVVLDEMRRLDWLSRTARRRAQEFFDTSVKLQSEIGREATSEEIRLRIGATNQEYNDYLAAVAAATVSFEISDLQPTPFGDEDSVIREIADPDWRNMLVELANEERMEFLTGYLDKLPENKRLVMMLYYYEELTLKEIGNVLGVTESRVCQIHATIIKDLRERFRTLEFTER